MTAISLISMKISQFLICFHGSHIEDVYKDNGVKILSECYNINRNKIICINIFYKNLEEKVCYLV